MNNHGLKTRNNAQLNPWAEIDRLKAELLASDRARGDLINLERGGRTELAAILQQMADVMLQLGEYRCLAATLEKRVAEVRPLVYLACPYSHPDETVRLARFEAVNKVAARLMSDGVMVFSPLSGSHPIALAGQLPLGFDFWESYDRAFLSCCHKLIVLKLDGWQESQGVQAEILIATEMGIKIEYLEADV